MMFLLRILLLVVAHCCLNSSFAALYSVFALISGLYCFGPVGLFIVGRNYRFIKMDSQKRQPKIFAASLPLF